MKIIPPKKIIEYVISSSRWLLIPFYLKLFWTLVTLMYAFFTKGILTSEQVMTVLEDVDIVMIANLVKMIITGSYNSFVDKSHGMEGEHTSSGLLKVKMSTSILGVSAINLLRTFINADNVPIETIHKQLLIHGIFIVGSLALALIDYLHCKTETSNT